MVRKRKRGTGRLRDGRQCERHLRRHDARAPTSVRPLPHDARDVSASPPTRRARSRQSVTSDTTRALGRAPPPARRAPTHTHHSLSLSDAFVRCEMKNFASSRGSLKKVKDRRSPLQFWGDGPVPRTKHLDRRFAGRDAPSATHAGQALTGSAGDRDQTRNCPMSILLTKRHKRDGPASRTGDWSVWPHALLAGA